MIRRSLILAALLLAMLLQPALALEFVEGPTGVDPFAGPEEEKQAVEQAAAAAQAWLDLVDQGAYEKSWQNASHLFRLALPPEQWQRQMLAGRKPMGELVERKRSSAQYTETLPGAPDGAYVVFQFATVFSRKSRAVETVTMQLESDGTWRAGGYYIR